MTKINNSWKTPLGYYERAIEELRRSREELHEMRTTYLQSLESKSVNDNCEMSELNSELQSLQEKLSALEKTERETQQSLVNLKEELQAFKTMASNEKALNAQIITEITEIKQQINNIVPQIQENIQNQNAQVLLELNLKLAELAQELTLVSYISGTDYKLLQKLLVEQKWREADHFTYSSILQACDREQDGWLDDGDIKKLPRHDLYIINHLWLKYSEGNFGFTPQKSFWQAQKSFEDFAVKVGWMKIIDNHHKFVNYDDYNFSLDAPKGHFPCTTKLVGLGHRSTGELGHRIKIFMKMLNKEN